jgi:hypothetical protein
MQRQLQMATTVMKLMAMAMQAIARMVQARV